MRIDRRGDPQMKIISNFKDYYDFLIGKYGIDDKCVYERICSTEDQTGKWYKTGIYKPKHADLTLNYSFEVIAVCGVMYCCYFYRGRHYFGVEAKDYIPKKVYNDNHEGEVYTGSDLDKAERFHLKKTNLNEKENCPVLILGSGHGYYDYAGVKNPKLADFDFGKVLPAEDCYVQIANFISREKPVIDNRTDIQKIVGKGFDKKTSFRNTK